jgi:hypothetical protein
MTLPCTVSDVVAEHVVFEVECIDRMYLNLYVPGLQYAAGIVGYVHRQLGLPIASTAPLGRMTDAFGAAVRRFARDRAVPWVDFVKGQRKDDVMHRHLAGFLAAGRIEGVLFIGRAQEKTHRRAGPAGRPHQPAAARRQPPLPASHRRPRPRIRSRRTKLDSTCPASPAQAF